MKPVVLHTKIFAAACMVQWGEPDAAKPFPGRRNFGNRLEKLTPSVARGFISRTLRELGIVVPFYQRHEINRLVRTGRNHPSFDSANEYLARALEEFGVNASFGNKPPILQVQLEQQLQVAEHAIRLARQWSRSGDVLRRTIGGRFLRRCPSIIGMSQVDQNVRLLQRGKDPQLWMDWYLCYAAERYGLIVLSPDSDLIVVNEAYEAVLAYRPVRRIQIPSCRRIANSL